MVKEITADELNNILDNEDIFILDVREKDELEFGKIKNSILIPVREIQQRIKEIPKNAKIIVYCRTGHRSEAVCRFLEESGFETVYNLTEGIFSWKKFDPSVQHY